MSSNLYFNSDEKEISKCIENELEKTQNDVKEYVSIIENWIKTQPHLPETPSENMIKNFLVMNKFSIEKTKQKLDMYYTIRIVVPELFVNKNPFKQHMKTIADAVYYLPLPKLTPSTRRVMYCGFKETCTPDLFDMEYFVAHTYNTMEVLMQDGLAVGYTLITDCRNVTGGLVPKFSLGTLKKATIVAEKVFSNRMSGFHLINVHPYLETLINMAKAILPKKMAERMFVHKNLHDLYVEIPKNILPSDLGGDEKSLTQLNELWMKKFDQYKSRFDDLDQLKVDESKRPTVLLNDEVLGFHGNFRKLEVD